MDRNILLVHQIPSKIIDIIENSKKFCFLITPYFQSWNLLDRALEKAAADNRKIIFIFRDEYKAREKFSYLNENFGFDLIFVERLHTKLYMNEQESLITSMNLYDSSKENNFEIAYYFQQSTNSSDFLKQVIEDDILKTSSFILKGRYFRELGEIEHKNIEKKEDLERHRLGKKETRNNQRKNTNSIYEGVSTGRAYCIRCRTPMTFNRNKPLCPSCFETWSIFQNYEYRENYCHRCGKDYCDNYFEDITFAYPICNECFNGTI